MKELYDEALKYRGQTEAKDWDTLNPALRKALPKVWNTLDVRTTSWCAGFVNMLLDKLGKEGTDSLLARSFLKWGKAVDIKDAQQGDIVVLKRGNSSWQGHVGLFSDENKDTIFLLGGNQDNAVKIKGYNKQKLLGIRRG